MLADDATALREPASSLLFPDSDADDLMRQVLAIYAARDVAARPY